MADFRRFSSLAHPVQCIWHPRTVREKQTKVQGEMKMSAFEYAGNRALAAVFAFAVSAVCMAAAIVPASPNGFIV